MNNICVLCGKPKDESKMFSDTVCKRCLRKNATEQNIISMVIDTGKEKEFFVEHAFDCVVSTCSNSLLEVCKAIYFKKGAEERKELCMNYFIGSEMDLAEYLTEKELEK